MIANMISHFTANVMIVDDTPANLRLLSDMLKNRGFTPRPVPSGKLALQAMEIEPPDLVLLDVTMPEMDGYEVCRILKADQKLMHIPIIFISALTESFDKVKAFSSGGVDYITKPFQIDEVYARIENHLGLRWLQVEHENTIHNLEDLVKQQVKQISDSQVATIFALAKLAESRDDETGKHLERVRVFCKMLSTHLFDHSDYASQISPGFIENIYHASPLHDIGKVGIPDRILLKPAKLTPEEFVVMKQHTILGAQTMQAVAEQYPHNPLINMGIDIARSHHEHWDGSGYPDGLLGDAIPLSARIMAVADVYDALRSKRVYKSAFPHVEAYEIILKGGGLHFDPQVVEAFFALRNVFDSIYEKLKEKRAIFHPRGEG
jgi:putative two-component system response regulator